MLSKKSTPIQKNLLTRFCLPSVFFFEVENHGVVGVARRLLKKHAEQSEVAGVQNLHVISTGVCSYIVAFTTATYLNHSTFSR